MFDLQPHEIELLQSRMKSDIDSYCVDLFIEDHRNHLGASIIGHDCARHIWYAFRWVKFEVFNGRMLRLFDRGKREEDFIDKLLFGIGFKIYTINPNTNKQYQIVGALGHYGGSIDGVGISPYTELKEPILIEKKTHNKSSFAKLQKEKLVIGKPRHYAQMCAYGKEFGFTYGLYFAVCKDDDDIHLEIVKLDPRHADDLRAKASDIIFSPIPPPKLSLQPEYFECKFCAFAGICHHNEPVEKNCRSCRFAQPAEKAEWGCNFWGQLIPKNVIPKGCEKHQGIGS